jgi:hypothetical protein
MKKISTKKMLTVLISLAMVFSALAVISMAAQPAYATSSGTVTYNPTTLGLGTSTGPPIQTVAFVSGGTFSSGATIYFYLSTTDSSAGLVATAAGPAYDAIGYTTLTATSPTTLNQAVTFFHGGEVWSGSGYAAVPTGTITPGVYYILASDQVPTSIATPSALNSYAFPAAATQFVVQTASLSILNAINDLPATTTNALTVGGTGIAYGTGFDSGASVSVTLSYPGGTVLVTATANSAGIFAATFTVPQLAGTVDPSGTVLGTGATSIAYTAVAQETNAYSSAFPQGGITADSTFDVGPVLTVSPMDYSGAAGFTLTLTGTGFPGGAVMSASSVTSPSTSIEITDLATNTLASSTYHSAVTVSSTGQFTVTVTTVSAITATGPYSIYITMTDTPPYETPINELFTPAVYVSVPNPQAPGFYFNPVAISGDYYPTVNSLTAAVFDFPASATVSIYIGSTLLGTVTTDSNGFALSSVSTLPAMPAGSYIVNAVDSSLGLSVVPNVAGYTVGSSLNPLVLTAFFQVTDPVGNVLTYTESGGLITSGEYVPQNGTLMVSAFGLAPGAEYSPTDSSITNTNIAEYGTNVTPIIGTVALDGLGFIPAANGTLEFTYQPFYGYYVTTGTPVAIAVGSVTDGPYAPSGAMGYGEIGEPSTSLSVSDQKPGGPVTVTVANLIKPVSSQTFYPGTYDAYNLYIGTTEITSVPPAATTFSTHSLGLGVTFDVPTLSSGIYNISVTYEGQAVSLALPPYLTAIGDGALVVSTGGSSVTSGSLKVIPTYKGGLFYQYETVGYGLLASTSYDLAIYTSSGPVSPLVSGSTDVYGAFIQAGVPSTSSDSAGTYGVVLTMEPGTASATEFYATYTVTASLSLHSPSGHYNRATGVYEDFIGDTVTLVAGSQAGLVTGAYYDLYFGSMYLETISAVSATSFGSGVTFTVPTVPYGLYYLNITFTGKTAVVASQPFYVLPSYYGTLTISSAQGLPTEYAFPGELVNFVWTPSNTPVAPSSTAGPVYVTAYLNGSAYTTFPAAYSAGPPVTLSGSFLMPNAAAGSYFLVTLGWTQDTYTTETAVVADPFSNPTLVTQATSGTLQSPSYTTGASQAFYEFFYPSSGTATLTLGAQINFGGNVFTFSTVAPLITGTYSTTATAVAPSVGTVTGAVFVVTSLSLNAAGTASSVSFYIMGQFNGQQFNSAVVSETSIGSTATDYYYGYAALTGTYDTTGTVTSTTVGSHTQSPTDGAYMQLVQGNGALLTGISSGQIATITADVTNAVTTSMKVPLSELNASVVAINGAVAKINTAFGNMTATLSSINATVQSISAGQVLVLTKLGSVETSLASLNASLMMVSGNVATINTTLGMVQTSLSSIGATVSSTATSVSGLVGSTATIKTDLGNISGQVTGVSNGVATIQTSIGKLNSTVSQIQLSAGQIKSSSNTLEIFLIVALVLILITLVIAFLAVNNTNRLAKKFEEQKKQ